MINLSQIDTSNPKNVSKALIKKETEVNAKRIGLLQKKLLASNNNNLLVILQGMDASGKDGTSNSVFKYCSPGGTDQYSFKKPTEEEMDHDFLWRVHQHAPRKGKIMIFNRSHYEDILIQRVHGWIDEKRVLLRMEAINLFERLLIEDNNTSILKFYLHISPEDQKKELQERIDTPDKNWKHNPNDWEEAKKWDEYRACYEFAINNSVIPWEIIPADKGWYRNYLVSRSVLDSLEKMNLKYPIKQFS